MVIRNCAHAFVLASCRKWSGLATSVIIHLVFISTDYDLFVCKFVALGTTECVRVASKC